MQHLVVIPTYNEAANIRALVTKIDQYLVDYAIYFVDDNSQDGTAKIIQDLSKDYPLHLFERTGKQGLGSAYIYGFKQALKTSAAKIITMDADLSHDPRYLPQMLAKNADVVLGSRYIPGGGVKNWGPLRRLMSRTANLLASTLLHVPAHDLTGAFRVFRREVLEALNLDRIKSDGYSFFEEILYHVARKNFTIAEVPIVFEDRQYGESKLSKKEIPKFLWMLVRLRFKKIR